MGTSTITISLLLQLLGINFYNLNKKKRKQVSRKLFSNIQELFADNQMLIKINDSIKVLQRFK